MNRIGRAMAEMEIEGLQKEENFLLALARGVDLVVEAHEAQSNGHGIRVSTRKSAESVMKGASDHLRNLAGAKYVMQQQHRKLLEETK